ncbi:MAG: HEPN domain-containing protein [Oscillospiraceae bacterium]|nr:HEPN domain-containing protein [Oscillospiraceae bacterium]
MAHEFDLAKHRLVTAAECLKSAKDNLATENYKTAANRSYYCIFNAMRSVMALEGIDYKRHSGLIGHFRRNYIKNNIFEKELSITIEDLLHARTACDYDDFYVVNKSDVEQQIIKAEYFWVVSKHMSKTKSRIWKNRQTHDRPYL